MLNDMISLAKTTLLSLDHFQKELVRQGKHMLKWLCNIMNIRLLTTGIQ